MSNLDRLNKIINVKKSNWEEEAKWRSENESWLTDSFDIALKILESLKARKMTQKELADRMKVTPQFISKVVKGQENLSLETIGKLSIALGIKLIEIAAEEKQSVEVTYNVAQAYEVLELFRKEMFTKVTAQGYVGLEASQAYAKEEVLEYRMQA